MNQDQEKLDLEVTEPGRLDKILTEGCEGRWSRTQIESTIQNMGAAVNGKLVFKPSLKLKIGDKISIRIVEKFDYRNMEPSDRPLDIIFQDEHLLVINKPCGLVVHPGAGTKGDTLINALLGILGDKLRDVGEVNRPGIVHRLDKDTTGLMVVAKTNKVLRALAKNIADRKIKRVYQALVLTTPKSSNLVDIEDQGVIETNIGRDPKNRERFIVCEEGEGRRAVTHFRVRKRGLNAHLLELALETGRTHQIRVHLAWVGSPIIGDRVYGDHIRLPKDLKKLAEDFGRQALHAWRLKFVHPISGQDLTFEVPPPPDFLTLQDKIL